MKKILFIYASPTKKTIKGSCSSLALDIFKEEYKKHNLNDEIIMMDLNSEKVGIETLTSDNFHNFFINGLSDHHIDLLKSLDKLVIASPMTNFNYPAVLKNYLDHILVAKKTFIYKYDGKGTSEGLLKKLKVQLILTQGASLGWYQFASHQKTLEGTFEFVGATLAETILIDGTKTFQSLNITNEEKIKPFLKKIKSLATKF